MKNKIKTFAVENRVTIAKTAIATVAITGLGVAAYKLRIPEDVVQRVADLQAAAKDTELFIGNRHGEILKITTEVFED